MNQPTPIRHGDWRMINGELVDFSKQPAPTASNEPSTPAKTSAVASSGRTRNRSKKR